MNQLSFLALVIVVMVLAGALGGLVNYLLQRKEEPESSNFWRSLALGWAAAFLVPLFLNMIASSLMSDIRTEPSKALVFLGFCLVAAISSTAFIKTLSERVLQEAREAKKVAGAADKKVVEVAKKVSEMEPEVERVVDRLTEPEPLSAVAAQASLPAVADAHGYTLLKELSRGRWAFRTLTGLCKESGMGQPEVERVLGELKNQKLVDWKMITRKAGDQKQRWFITEAGREELARVESASPADVAVQAGDDSQGQSW